MNQVAVEKDLKSIGQQLSDFADGGASIYDTLDFVEYTRDRLATIARYMRVSMGEEDRLSTPTG